MGKSQKFSDQLPYVKTLISLLNFAIFRLWGARPKKAADQTRDPRSAGAYRAEVALLFLVQEARGPNSGPQVGRRLEQRWPYYFLCRRLADQSSGPQVGRRLEQRAADAEEAGLD